MLHRRRRRRQFFIDVSWEGTGELIVGQVKELKSGAAVECSSREVAGEVVVGEVHVRQVLEAANGRWDWTAHVEVLEDEGGHLAVAAAACNPSPVAVRVSSGRSRGTAAVLP